MNSLKRLLDQLNGAQGPLSIWTTGTEGDVGYAVAGNSTGTQTINSYFSDKIAFQVKEADALQVISKIQQTKKAQVKTENWDVNELRSRFEKIKSIVEENKSSIAGLEAHFQGTTRKFQLEWSVGPILNMIDQFLDQSEKYDVASAKGLIGAITPRASSFYEIGWRILFAIFHKDGVLIKPATETALSAVIWQEVLRDCDIPDSLVSFVYGSGQTVGNLLFDHPGVKNLSFSGSHDSLKSYTLTLEKKYQLFLNGKNAVCVLSDFDYKSQMKNLVRLFIEHNGRSVFSPSRLFVIDTVEKDFKQALAAYLLTVPTLKSIDDEFGYLPLRDFEKKKMLEIKSRFESEEAKIIYGNDDFLFYSDLPNCSELYQENLELPVYNLTAVKYSHEMVKWLNNSSFGHSVVIFGPEEKTKKLAMKSEVGKVIFNPMSLKNEWVSPVKMSGFGEVNNSIPNSFYSYVKV
tara:strand:+ start:52099 stop:53481 length:1383 start_codon:yes stop_codon:yes gene_type:complete